MQQPTCVKIISQNINKCKIFLILFLKNPTLATRGCCSAPTSSGHAGICTLYNINANMRSNLELSQQARKLKETNMKLLCMQSKAMWVKNASATDLLLITYILIQPQREQPTCWFCDKSGRPDTIEKGITVLIICVYNMLDMPYLKGKTENEDI